MNRMTSKGPNAELTSAPDLRHLTGPFDIIGDVHGCAEELQDLLGKLEYRIGVTGSGASTSGTIEPPKGRRAVFVGDFVDRGPAAPDVLRLVMTMVEAGQALAVLGNHDDKFLRWLEGRPVKISHGLDRTIAQFATESPSFAEQVRHFLPQLPLHLWLAGGELAVAHAGLKPEMFGETSRHVRRFCLYGETTGETDEFGLPIRYHWAATYRGRTKIIYGHTPVPDADWVNNTLCIDTGCCFGGKLTALRWPERAIVETPAIRTYSPPVRPFGHPPVRSGTA